MKVWIVTQAYADDPDGGMFVARVYLEKDKDKAEAFKMADQRNRDIEEFEVEETSSRYT